MLYAKDLETRKVSNRIQNYFIDTHAVKDMGDYLHYGCKACNNPVGRSGVLHIPTGTVRCLQPSCRFHNYTYHTKYIEYVESVSYTEAKEILDKYPEKVHTIKVYKTKKLKVLTLPQNSVPLIYGNNEYGNLAREYITEKRGFDLKWVFENYRLHYVGYNIYEEDYNRYFGRILIPFFDRIGKMIYYQGRDFMGREDKNVSRWDNPPKEDTSIGKSNLLYNSKDLYNYDDVFITEGIWDTLELKRPEYADLGSSSILGSYLSPDQLVSICNSPCKNIYFALDHGAYRAAIDMALQVVHNSDKNVYVLPITGGDCNSLGKKRILEYCKNPVQITPKTYAKELAMIEVEGNLTFRGQPKKYVSMFNTKPVYL